MDVSLRRAALADSRFVWEVNNDAGVRAQSISTENIPWELHQMWFAKTIVDSNVLFFIAEFDGAPAAVARFNIDHNGAATIGVAVASSFRGKGLGTMVIEQATRELKRVRPLAHAIAWIRPGNPASMRAFLRAGYVRRGSDVIRGVSLVRFEYSGR